MRLKEGSSDYRYFPDPDLGPIEITKAQQEIWFKELPELPPKKRNKYVSQFGLSAYDARVISDEISMANFFEETVANGAEAKLASNWVTSDIVGYLKSNKLSFSELKLSPENLAEMINMISKNIISGKIAKEILPELIQKNISPKKLVEEKGLAMISDSSSITPIIDELINEHPNEVQAFKNGKTKLLGFFVGQLMKRTKGKADPKLANKLLTEKLNN
jgi:aspartyl-tRNA(Asn)/glutamyl-tRNA(Gln) amidotransferase subunit B